MPQDMWGSQGTAWEGGRLAVWRNWFSPSIIYISQIWTEVISLGSKLLTLLVTSVSPRVCSLALPFYGTLPFRTGLWQLEQLLWDLREMSELWWYSSAFPGLQPLLLGVLVCMSQRELASVSVSRVWGHSKNSYIWPYTLPSPNLSCTL